MIEHIPELIDAGIDSFKIEGRMKTALYVATVARTYRKAIDDYLQVPELYEKNMPWYQGADFATAPTGSLPRAFSMVSRTSEAQIYDSNTYVKEYTYLGIVGGSNAEGLYRIEQRNKFSVGETIEIMKPNGDNIKAKVLSHRTTRRARSRRVHPIPSRFSISTSAFRWSSTILSGEKRTPEQARKEKLFHML